MVSSKSVLLLELPGTCKASGTRLNIFPYLKARFHGSPAYKKESKMSWLPKQKVLIPVDFSDESIGAVRAALELVESSSHLNVIHVLPVISAAEPGVIWDTFTDEARCDSAVKQLRAQLAQQQITDVQLTATVGDPGHEITDHAQRIGADLIVMPSHGRTGIKHILLGSVAERVVRLAHCPVLVLRS
jgi:nucleotide-binding universal stress UspA family protein